MCNICSIYVIFDIICVLFFFYYTEFQCGLIGISGRKYKPAVTELKQWISRNMKLYGDALHGLDYSKIEILWGKIINSKQFRECAVSPAPLWNEGDMRSLNDVTKWMKLIVREDGSCDRYWLQNKNIIEYYRCPFLNVCKPYDQRVDDLWFYQPREHSPGICPKLYFKIPYDKRNPDPRGKCIPCSCPPKLNGDIMHLYDNKECVLWYFFKQLVLIQGVDKDYVMHNTRSRYNDASFIYLFRRVRKKRGCNGNYFTDKRKGEGAIRQVPAIVDKEFGVSISSGTNYSARINKHRKQPTSLGYIIFIKYSMCGM